MKLQGPGAGLAAALASLAALFTTNLSTIVPVPAPAGLVTLPGAGSPAPTSWGARTIGPAAPEDRVDVQLYFRPRDPTGLAALAAAVSAPGNSEYHHFLTVAQFAARFGASAASVGTIDNYLRSYGLVVGPLGGNRLAQDVSGTAGHLSRALGAELSEVRTAKGKIVLGTALAPRLPADLAPAVALVGGLDPWATESSDLVRFPRRVGGAAAGRAGGGASGSQASLGARRHDSGQSPVLGMPETCAGMPYVGLTPAQLQSIYGFAPFYNDGDLGQGTTVGFIEYALADVPAIATFQKCVGSSVNVTYVTTSGPPTQVNSEAAADVEVIAALAPKANVVVYESNQAGTGLAPWELAISGTAAGGLPDVISSSWGSCEAQTGLGTSYYQEEQSLFEEAAAQGQTVLAASGDDGSEGCFQQSQGAELAVDDPATAPGVTAVGGTASDSPSGPQYVWNSRHSGASGCLGTGCSTTGASGGGGSSVWPRPAYQPASLPQPEYCSFGPAGCREVPDVSALAGDPYAQYCSGSVCGGGDGWVGIGGTSLATPSWAAAVALSENLCATKVGFLNPLLYSEPNELTGPVTSGNNDLLGSNNGLYGASADGGYSMAAGLGYLGGTDIALGALCGPNNLLGSTPPTTTSTTTGTTTPAGTGTPTPAGTRTVARACTLPVNQRLLGQPAAILGMTDLGCAGYWVVSQSGDVAAFGSALSYGSLNPKPGTTVMAIAATPDDKGYWLLASNGRVGAFGDAQYYGQPASRLGRATAVGIAASPDGRGYWVATGAGRVYAYGDARPLGSAAGLHLERPITGIAAAPQGMGYWLVGADGGVFGFGDAAFNGSLAGVPLNGPVVGISAGGGKDSYRLVGADGGVFTFGTAFYGSLGADPPGAPVVGIAASVDGGGYYVLDASGAIYGYGDAAYVGRALT
ncbi:MAG TPA: S53 family peptidase [Acidimicrobiales bacterium]|nr:S53 family peptidase [Acidimicrobiales bacterium]